MRRDLKPDNIAQPTVEQGFVTGQFREARDEAGNLSFLSPQDEEKIIASMPLVEVD